MSNDQQQFCRPIVLPDVPGEVTSTTGPIWRKMTAWARAGLGEPALSASRAFDASILSALRTYATEAVRQDRMGRPLTACDSAIATAAIKTLEGMGYSWNGGVLWKPPVGTAPAADGWIEWNGGECPVPGNTKVHIKLRRGYDASKDAHSPGFEAMRFWWNHNNRDSDIVAYKLVKKHSTAPASTAPTGPTAGQTWFVGFIGEGDSTCSGGQVYRARIERLTDKVAELQVKRPYEPEGEIPQTYAYRRAAVEFIEKVEG